VIRCSRRLPIYYARPLAWYTKGRFMDECGKRHESGYHYPIPYCEVLNEGDFEHGMTPQIYTPLYDAIVTAVLTLPQMHAFRSAEFHRRK
jgi:hypothetical protein